MTEREVGSGAENSKMFWLEKLFLQKWYCFITGKRSDAVGGAGQGDVGRDSDDSTVTLVVVRLEVVFLVAGCPFEHLALQSLLEASTRLEHGSGLDILGNIKNCL
jgi:hypothetical protein